MSPIYCRDASAALLVFDLTNKESFEKLNSWVSLFTEVADSNAIISLVANKCDLEDQQKVTKDEILKWAQSHHFTVFFTSAKSGENISNVFQSLAKSHLVTKGSSRVGTFKIQIPDESKKKSCC